MASISNHFALCILAWTNRRSGHERHIQKLHCLNVNGTKSFKPSAKVDLLSQHHGIVVTCVDTAENVRVFEQQVRQKIPTKKQLVDPYRQGFIIEAGVGYRQTVVVRSYEVGPDKTATIESILNLLQVSGFSGVKMIKIIYLPLVPSGIHQMVMIVRHLKGTTCNEIALSRKLCSSVAQHIFSYEETALNHVWMSGLLSDGFGATHGMMRNNLIWVVSRMQVQVDHYPIWGEVMEIDTWVGASGKNGMRRDWLLKSQATGLVFARATSTWVMMNQQTRRLSKMPDEVRAEISPWFIEKQAIQEESPEKIDKLDNNARYVHSDLKPKRGDLDMNQHVNNVKYVGWMLETIPDEFLKNHQLSSITLEYRRECGSSDIVQSLCEPREEGLLKPGIQNCNTIGGLNGHSLSSEILQGNGLLGSLTKGPFSYTHMLQVKGESKNEEIVRGKTTWKRKLSPTPFPP